MNTILSSKFHFPAFEFSPILQDLKSEEFQAELKKISDRYLYYIRIGVTTYLEACIEDLD